MTVEQQRKRDWGRTVTWIGVLIIAGIALGITIANRAQAPRQTEPEPSLAEKVTIREFLRAPACAVPAISIALLTLGFTVIQGYYGVQRLETQRRIQAAAAAEREEEVRLRAMQTARQRLELNDLTVNLATGEEVARLIEGPNGELLLVRPGLATKPVSRLNPDEVREDSDQVRVAAMLANAARYSRGKGYPGRQQSSDLSLELAALAMLNGGAPERRLPGKIRVLKDDELRMLEAKRREE